jgi:hypothetical protein
LEKQRVKKKKGYEGVVVANIERVRREVKRAANV